MSDQAPTHASMHALPEGDVIRILLDQHDRIRELFATVNAATDQETMVATFDELRALLAVHETAEEMVLRPVSRRSASAQVAEARNEEESEANEVLAQLESMEVGSPEFSNRFAAFEKSVERHAEAEEHQEFPAIVVATEEKDRQRMGSLLEAVEKMAPTHPHPGAAGSTAAQWTVGPFASMADRARDAIAKMMA